MLLQGYQNFNNTVIGVQQSVVQFNNNTIEHNTAVQLHFCKVDAHQSINQSITFTCQQKQ